MSNKHWPLERTAFPCIYKRARRYVVVYRDLGGQQHKRSCPTLGDAITTQAAIREAVEEERREILRKINRKATRSGRDTAAAYGELRAALQAADNAYSSARGRARTSLASAISAMHNAEDLLIQAMRDGAVVRRGL